MSRVKNRRAHRARKTLGWLFPWEWTSLHKRSSYTLTGRLHTPEPEMQWMRNRTNMACKEWDALFLGVPLIDQSSGPTATMLAMDYKTVEHRVVSNYLVQAAKAERMMQGYVEMLKAEGYTQQVPGWNGVLVSPDGRTIVES